MTDNAAPPEKPQRGSKRAPGRYATGITPEQESAVIEAMATQHVTLDVACRLAGVTVSVAYAWQRWGEAPDNGGKNWQRYHDFAEGVARARARSEAALVGQVAGSAYPNGMPKADGAQMLLRTRYGYNEKVEIVNAARDEVLSVVVAVLREELDAATLQRVGARLASLRGDLADADAAGEPH